MSVHSSELKGPKSGLVDGGGSLMEPLLRIGEKGSGVSGHMRHV